MGGWLLLFSLRFNKLLVGAINTASEVPKRLGTLKVFSSSLPKSACLFCALLHDCFGSAVNSQCVAAEIDFCVAS